MACTFPIVALSPSEQARYQHLTAHLLKEEEGFGPPLFQGEFEDESQTNVTRHAALLIESLRGAKSPRDLQSALFSAIPYFATSPIVSALLLGLFSTRRLDPHVPDLVPSALVCSVFKGVGFVFRAQVCPFCERKNPQWI